MSIRKTSFGANHVLEARGGKLWMMCCAEFERHCQRSDKLLWPKRQLSLLINSLIQSLSKLGPHNQQISNDVITNCIYIFLETSSPNLGHFKTLLQRSLIFFSEIPDNEKSHGIIHRKGVDHVRVRG
jgi:hypothetical protein